MSTRVTVDQLMSHTNLDRPSCYGLLRFLEQSGLATVEAAPRDPKQRGRSQALYRIREDAAMKLHQLLSNFMVDSVVSEEVVDADLDSVAAVG
jgi:predicted ArsR family transcriptional regulator